MTRHGQTRRSLRVGEDEVRAEALAELSAAARRALVLRELAELARSPRRARLLRALACRR